jgi:Zn-dependent protease
MDTLERIFIWAVPVLFSVVIHEVAHGWVAYRLGDPTAKQMGRLTLNPIHHIDIMGTVILPLMLIVLGGPVFGWAKPVPFNPRNFRRDVDIKNGTLLVALAGPGSNLILAFLASFLFVITQKFFSGSHTLLYLALYQLTQAILIINLVLAFINLIPIPPLDGSKILLRFLPQRFYQPYFMLERYGFLIVIILFASGVLSPMISKGINFLLVIFLSIPLYLFS